MPEEGKPRDLRPGEEDGLLAEPLRTYATEVGLVMRRPPLTPYTMYALEATEHAQQQGKFDAFTEGYNVVAKQLDTDHWSAWSPPYDFAAGLRDETLEASAWRDGTQFVSKSPARYLQLEVSFSPTSDTAPPKRIGPQLMA